MCKVLQFIQEIRKRRYRKLWKLDPSITFGLPLFISVKNIHIGKGTTIGNRSYIVSGEKASVRIGEFCDISYNVQIRAATHDPYNTKKIIEKDIEIGNHVWICTNAYIGEGVTIGDHAVIGANSVVKHDVPAYQVVGGVPARLLYVKDYASAGM